MPIIHRISTYRNYQKALNIVKKTEKHILQNSGAYELKKSCDTLHISLDSKKNLIARIKDTILSFFKPDRTYNAAINTVPKSSVTKYRCSKMNGLCGPDTNYLVVVDNSTKNITLFKESIDTVERTVIFNTDKTVRQIYYEGYNAPDKTIFYNNGRREVSKFSK